MKNHKIRTACAVLAAVMGLSVMTGCGDKALDGTKVVAQINDNQMPLGVASFALRYNQTQTEYYYSAFSSMYGSDEAMTIWDNKPEDAEGKTFGEKTKADIMETLQKMYLVRDHANEYGVELTDQEQEDIKAAAQAFIENNDEKMLAHIGATQADVEEYLELDTYYRKANEPFVADVEIEVTDSEAAQSTITYSYRAIKNLEAEAQDEAREELQQLLETYKQNGDAATMDMDEIAQEQSETFVTTTSSFGEDDTNLEDELKAAVAELKDGELYDGVVESENTYYVVRMDQVMDEAATASKKDSMIAERQQEAFDELVQGWLDEATVNVENNIWKKITLTDKESYTMKQAEVEEQDETVDLVPEDVQEDEADEDEDVTEDEQEATE